MRDFSMLKAFMDNIMSKVSVSGIDCIVYQDHQEIFRHTAGYGDIDQKTPPMPGSLYNIYSGTKMIVCVAALQLLERGLLSIFDPVAAYLPEFRNMLVKYAHFTVTPAQKPILISDLFTMTAGISYDPISPEIVKLRTETNGDFGTRDFVSAIAREPLWFEPGAGWHYSYCHDVLGAVIEVVSGMSLGEYLRKNIFEPLGMKDSGFSVQPGQEHRLAPQYQYNPATGVTARISGDCIGRSGTRHESGGGGLISTPEDYILFIDAMACGGTGKSGARIISPRTIDLLRTNRLDGKQMEDFRRMALVPGIGYGLGVGVFYDPVAAGRIIPKNSFYWGGVGGLQNLVDTENRIAYHVAQHTVLCPKEYFAPGMTNALYACL